MKYDIAATFYLNGELTEMPPIKGILASVFYGRKETAVQRTQAMLRVIAGDFELTIVSVTVTEVAEVAGVAFA